jgi:hypothetical protein
VDYSTSLSSGQQNSQGGQAPAGGMDQALVEEAAQMLRDGSKQHHVGKMLENRGLGFMDRGYVLTAAKKLNKELRRRS